MASSKGQHKSVNLKLEHFRAFTDINMAAAEVKAKESIDSFIKKANSG
jgi:hypothetical protein